MSQQRRYWMDDEDRAVVQPSAAYGNANLPSTDFLEREPEFEESVDFRDYIDVVLRRKWLVMTFIVLAFCTTLVVSLRAVPLFKTTGRLEVHPRPPKVTKFEDISASQVDTWRFRETQAELLQSRSLAQRVVEELGAERLTLHNSKTDDKASQEGASSGISRALQRIKENAGRYKQAFFGWIKGVEERDSRKTQMADGTAEIIRRQNLVNLFLGGLQVSMAEDTDIISITYVSPEPVLARDAVNTLLDEFIEWEMDKRIASAARAKTQLDKQIETARIELEKSEDRLNEFASKAGIVSLDSRLNAVYRQLEEINDALAKAESERLSKEALFEVAKQGNIDSLPRVMDSGLMQNLRENQLDLKSQYEELRTTYKDGYPKVKALKARISDIEQKITEEEQRIFQALKKEYETALEKESSLRKKAAEKKALALELNEKATQYKILEREVETNKQIHQSLLQRGKEIEANLGAGLTSIQVVDYAQLPLSPFKPNVRKNLLLAIVLGLMAGVGVAFLLEYMDNTVKGMDEISDRFKMPVLGTIPFMDKKEQQHLYRYLQLKPEAGFSESVRTARFSIQLYSPLDDPPKTILVTSSAEDEGKTTIACNLAQAFAASEEKVLLIDCDLRKPRHHLIFGNHSQNGRKGLIHLLSGVSKIEDAIQKTESEDFYHILAGPRPPNPAEMLASNRMRKTIQALSQHFDRIILDSPPFAGFADVLILSNQVDGIVLVATLGETPRQALRMFRRSILNVKGNLLGCIVNKLDRSYRYSDYYYHYYNHYKGYYGHYGSDHDEKLEFAPVTDFQKGNGGSPEVESDTVVLKDVVDSNDQEGRRDGDSAEDRDSDGREEDGPQAGRQR